ncbi:DUF3959 family protein [Bacillus cereus]
MGNGEEIRCALNATERPLPIVGLTKQIPLEQSVYIGGLLFFTSFCSYFA